MEKVTASVSKVYDVPKFGLQLLNMTISLSFCHSDTKLEMLEV
jgi:hypothetical protein